MTLVLSALPTAMVQATPAHVHAGRSAPAYLDETLAETFGDIGAPDGSYPIERQH